jgi:uncharacterized phage protein (TIGR02218 family)/uncharacterized protein (TIGR02217 family)
MRTLILDEQYPIVATCRFNNSFTELADGRQQIVVSWQQPVLEYDLSRAILSESKLKYLMQFFDEVSAGVFLYKDPADHLCSSFAYEPRPGLATWGQLFPVSATQWQLCKVYQAGDSTCVRPISRPDRQELIIGSTAAYVVDVDTGRVEFTDAVNETEIFWSGSFFVPVTLENQDFSYKIESNLPEYTLPEFRFKEVREVANSFTPGNRTQYLDVDLDLDLIVGSIFTYEKKISNVYADNNWYKDLKLWEHPRVKIATAQKTIANQDEVEAAIALYRVTCGGAIGFNYQDKTVRIENSPLVVTVDSEFNFGIGTLELIQTNEIFGLDKIDAQTYIVPILQSSVDSGVILSAITQFRGLLKHRIFEDNEELIAKYFQEPQIIAAAEDQRWLRWLVQDYRQELGEPDKVAFILFMDSLSPFYDESDNSDNIILNYRDDAGEFTTSRYSRQSFAAVIYTPGASMSLQDHLKAAYEGTGHYLYPLKRYNLQIRPEIPVDLTAESYLADMTTALTDFDFLDTEKSVNFVARCWELEQQTVSPQFIDLTSNFRDQLISPIKPNYDDNTYLAYLFGSYKSTRAGEQDSPRQYWRTRFPVKGRQLKNRRELFIKRTSDNPAVYYDRVVVDIGNAALEQSDLFRLDLLDFVNLSFAPFPTGKPLYLVKGVLSFSPPTTTNMDIRGGIPASDLTILDIVPLEAIPSGERIPAYFEKGQCPDVMYRFSAAYGDGQRTVLTIPFDNVPGPITSVQVYLDYRSSQNTWIYNLSVMANGVRRDGIQLNTLDGPLTTDRAPLGIYHIIATRADGQPDNCGNYDDTSFIQATVAPAKKVGFTNHDAAIVFNNTEFAPSSGGNAQARSHNGDLESSNNTETTFVLGDLFNYEDLLDGVWTGAKFTEWLVDWNNPSLRLKLATGHIGRITVDSTHEGGLSCKLEMRSLLARLQQKNYFLTVEQCPKTFGKQGPGNCRKSLFGLIDQLEVTEIIDPVTFKINSTRTQNNFYGQVTFLTGQRQNVARLIDSYDSTTKLIKLRSSLHGLVVGDKLNAIARCDKTLKACMDFDNAVNFGGFWHVPGIDKVARTDR